MKKLWVGLTLALGFVLAQSIYVGVASAQDDGSSNVHVSRLAIKVAEILGLDPTEVDVAIKQARVELQKEPHNTKPEWHQGKFRVDIERKLRTAVSNGDITPEEARRKLKVLRVQKADAPGGM